MTQSSTHTIQPLPVGQSLAQKALETDRQMSTYENTERDSVALGGSMALFNRERPLLDKIKAMRLEQSHLEN